jgi:hypothetical protein
MRLLGSLVIGLSLVTATASAQIDCGAGGALCATQKYGFGQLPGFRLDKVPADQNLFDYTPADFGPNIGGSSHYHSRGSFISGNANCGGERGFAPYTGQVHIRERTDCTPTGIGPTCVGGPNAGKQCHVLPDDGTYGGVSYVNPFRSVECPGGTCVDSGGGCRVEIPISDGGGVTPAGDSSDALLPTLTVGVAAGASFVLNAHASQTWGGSSHSVCINSSNPGALCRQHSDCPGGSCRSTCRNNTSQFCTTDAECTTGANDGCDIRRGTCKAGTNPGVVCLSDTECTGGGICEIVTCSDTNFRYKPSSGWRYLLPSTHPEFVPGTNPPQTYIRWDYGQVDATLSVRVANNTSIRTHSDDSATCCQSTQAACNALIPPTNPVYPLLNQRTCAVPNRYSFEDNVTNDWIFANGRGTAFYTDPHFVVPGQIAGLCALNPQQPCTAPASATAALCTAAGAPHACCTGPGTGVGCPAPAVALCTGAGTPYLCCTGPGAGATCGNECGGGDSCSMKEMGHRAQIVNGRDGFGDPRPRVCGANLYTIRGTPDQGCTIQPQFIVPGDPGNDCGLFNFGRDRRYDADCDGNAEFEDGCPFLSEWDQNKDSDPDCDDGVGGDCRLDECECGDQTGNGLVDVSDIVAANTAIFQGVSRRLCDANSDLVCTVSDLLGINGEIFDFDSSSCRHITSSRCGNNVVDPGEACDNGARCTLDGAPTATPCNATGADTCPLGQVCARIGGDGCNTSCRLE